MELGNYEEKLIKSPTKNLISILFPPLRTSMTTSVLASNVEQVLETAPQKAAAVRPLTTHHENYES